MRRHAGLDDGRGYADQHDDPEQMNAPLAYRTKVRLDGAEQVQHRHLLDDIGVDQVLQDECS